MLTNSEVSVSVNVTLKLGTSERDRLRALAASRDRSPHFLMKEAIHAYLEKEEANERFVQAAKHSLAQFNATGQHIALDAFSAWVKELRTNPNAAIPECHK